MGAVGDVSDVGNRVSEAWRLMLSARGMAGVRVPVETMRFRPE